MATANPNFDAIISTTLKKYRPQFEDAIFKDLPLLYWLKEGDRIERVDGGQQLVEPIEYGLNSTAGSYAGYDNILTTPQDGLTAAVYSWKQFAATVAISGLEEAQNNGDTAVINLLKTKVEQTQDTVSEKINQMLYADGTGNSSKDWSGLALYIPDNPATLTVGGIDRTDANNVWWRPNVDSTTTALTIPNMSTMFNNCSKGRAKYRPDIILTTQTLWEKYESLLQPGQRFTDPKTASAGFDNITYKSCPVMWDEYATATNMFFLTAKALKLKVHSDVWFKPTPFEKPHGQDARYSQILSYGELCVRSPRNIGKLVNRS